MKQTKRYKVMTKLMIEGLREKYAILDETIQNSDSNHENSYYALDALCESFLLNNMDCEGMMIHDIDAMLRQAMRFVRGEMDEEEAKQYLKSCWTEACKKSLKQLEQNDKD